MPCPGLLELHKNHTMDITKISRDLFKPEVQRQETSSYIQNTFKLLTAKDKIYLKLQVDASFKGNILLWQRIKIALVKLMVKGMVSRHVRVPLKLNRI